ncbi:hypothetical protein CFC21_078661 [Triticum aestivum]|uniref:F-box domain-containing protein n=2 Tax=Triticum aestivum TaxID=4565 RepID=A0A3B6MTV2_WHEAT|nr:hypothetical protein CFC21_078661 [Triticum aestivum]
MEACFLPTDLLVEILLRLPPSARRRARLVCKLWHDLVAEHTTEMQSRAKVLLWHAGSAAAYVVDDLSSSSTGSYTELWRIARVPGERTYYYPDEVQLVGTCNGLLCICDNRGERTGGTVTLVNPATGEKLSIPPLPGAAQFALNYHCQKWDRAYSFAYHPTSGQYKVVHVPCSFDRVCDYDAAHVLTLGEAAWREVPDSNGKRCNLHAGIVSVDGVTYWVTDGGTARIVSLDLDDEHVASSTMALPSLPDKPDDYNLTEVDGRLGVVLRSPSGTREAWVRDKGKWICRYVLRCKWQQIPRPYFAHGEYFLKFEGRLLLYVYSRKSGVVKVSRKDEGRLVAKMKDDSYGSNYQTFAYVKTSEPLGVYDGTK